MGQALRLAPARSAAFFGGLLCAHFCLAQTQNSANRAANLSATGSPPDSAPITGGDRLRWYVKATVSPLSFVTSAASAGFGQWRDRPKEWREGAGVMACDSPVRTASMSVRETLMFGASSVLHEDNRYLRSGEVRYSAAHPICSREHIPGPARQRLAACFVFANRSFRRGRTDFPAVATRQHARSTQRGGQRRNVNRCSRGLQCGAGILAPEVKAN